jgi:hypothetical protein
MSPRILAAITMLIIFGLVPFRVVEAQVCTHFVNASDGSDSGPGTNVAPVRSIEHAFNTFPEGSTICLAAGEYFYGADSDGIELSGSNKSVVFVLNQFADSSEIRISEKFFSIDVGLGTVKFVSGTASRLVIGQGIINLDFPSDPGLLNFAHSLRIRSGTLDFSGIDASVEQSVGNPGFVHPTNSQKVPPSSAAIEVNNGVLVGNITYAPAPRTFRFAASDLQPRVQSLPETLDDAHVIFQNTNLISVPKAVLATNTSFVFSQPGEVRFDDQFSLSTGISEMEFGETYTGSTRFLGSFNMVEGAGPLFLDILGPGSVEFAQLITALMPSTGLDVRSHIHQIGQGELTIRSLSAPQNSNGRVHRLDVTNSNGTLAIGSPGGAQSAAGSITNAGILDLTGDLIVLGDQSFPSLSNSGTLRLNGNRLILSQDNSVLDNTGEIQSDTGLILIQASTLFQGDGTVEAPIEVTAGSLDLKGGIQLESVSSTGASVNLTANETAFIAGGLFLGTGSALTIGPDASLSVLNFDVSNSNAAVFLDESSSLRVAGTFSGSASAPIFSSTKGHLWLDGDAQRLITSQNTYLPTIHFTSGGDVVIEDAAFIGGLDINGGAVNIFASSNLSVGSVIASGRANVTLNSELGLTMSDGMRSAGEGTQINLVSPESIMASGIVSTDGGSIHFPSSGISVKGFLRLPESTDAPIVLPAITMLESSSFLEISREITVQSDLDLSTGALLLNKTGVLRLMGALRRSGGIVSLESTGRIQFMGTGRQELSGFSDVVLPSILISAPDVVFPQNATLSGSLNIRSGRLSIADGSTLTLEKDFYLESGSVSFNGSSSLWVGNQFTMDTGLFEMGSGRITTNGNVIVSGGSLIAGTGSWILSGSSPSLLLLESAVTFYSLEVKSGVQVSLAGDGYTGISNQLRIGKEAVLLLGNKSVHLAGGGIQASVVNEGRFSGVAGFLSLESGPAGQSPTLSGDGLFGNLKIDLLDDQAEVLVLDTHPAFTLSGQLRFERGRLNLQDAGLVLSSVSGIPIFSFNLTDSNPENGIPDGGGLISSTGMVRFNESGSPFDLIFDGAVTNFFSPPAFLVGNGLNNLHLRATDAINNPSIFGLRLDEPVTASGMLEVERGSVLRLSNTLRLTGSGLNHILDGIVTGSGAVRVEGQGNVLTSEHGEGFVQNLVIAGFNSASPTIVRPLGSVADLTLEAGFTSFRPNMSGTVRLLTITQGFTQLAGTATSEIELVLGSTTSGVPATLHLDGSFAFVGNASIRMPLGGMIDIGDSAQILLTDVPEWSLGTTAGFIIVEEATTVDAKVPIPRLKLAAVKGRSNSDDTFLQSDLYISDALVLANGDLNAGRRSIFLENGSLVIDEDLVPFDGTSEGLQGDPSSSGNALVFSGEVDVYLGGNLELSSLGLRFGAPQDAIIRFLSVGGGFKRVTVFGRAAEINSGIVDLGLNDLVINSSSARSLIVRGGTILSEQTGQNGIDLGFASSNQKAFPFLDSDFGEIILIGSGNASILMEAAVAIPNLTLNGTVRLETTSLPVIVSNRFVFGEQGASFILNKSNDLEFRSGAQIVRRGVGTLSHFPSFGDSIDVFYDLDDGSVTGLGTGYSQASLITGLEIPLTSNVGILGILAGNDANQAHTVRLSSDFSLSDTLVVYSGTLNSAGKRIQLADNAVVMLNGLDRDSAPKLETAAAFFAEDTYDIHLIQRYNRMDLTDSFKAETGRIGLLTIGIRGSLGPLSEAVRITTGLAVRDLEITSSESGGRLVLGGGTFNALGDIDLTNVLMTSTQISSVFAEGSITMNPGTRVTGNISLTSAKDLQLAGSFEGIRLTIGRDLVYTGTANPSAFLEFNGSEQKILTSRNMEVSSLLLNQTGTMPSVLLESVGSSRTLTVLSSVQFTNGVLITGKNEFRVGSGATISRNVAPGTFSHVVGTTGRNINEGANSEFVFPVGTRTQYLPLSITFTDPLLSSSYLTVLASDDQVLNATGLPLAAESGTILSVSNPVWTLKSTVNFGQSQKYILATTIPRLLSGPSGAHRMLSRASARGQDAWAITSGTALNALTSSGLILRNFDSRGGLRPGGMDFAIGLTSPNDNASLLFQIADLRLNQGANSGAISVNTAPSISLTTGEFYSAELPFYSPSLPAQPVEISLLLGAQNISSRLIGFTGDNKVLSILFETENGSSNGTILNWNRTEPAILGNVDVRFLNLTSSTRDFSIHMYGTAPTVLLENLPYQTVPDAISWTRGRQYVELQDATSSSLIDVFRFDLSNTSATEAIVAAVWENGKIRMKAFTANGKQVSSVIVTGNEGSEPELPLEFALNGNYPNPFNPTTNISFSLPQVAEVQVLVFDVLGRMVRRVDAGQRPAQANQTIAFDGSGLASGTYFYHLTARSVQGISQATGSMILLK